MNWDLEYTNKDLLRPHEFPVEWPELFSERQRMRKAISWRDIRVFVLPFVGGFLPGSFLTLSS